jgi:pimeloyl-ACP methyl ester carboxylesterase
MHDPSALQSVVPPAAPGLKPPSALMLMLEGRAPMEFAALIAAAPWLSRLPFGDGHPVLVFPGLCAGDFTTMPLRRFLRARGYAPYAWDQGLNLGPRHGVLEGCMRRAQSLYERHQRPVSLLGWSLGGVYAREVAKELAQRTRCVITLGAPFAGHPRATNAWRFYELLNGKAVNDRALIEQVRKAPPVPTTSIYSRTDGVVAWQCSINDDAEHTENIEISASHFGMGMNPLALYAVVDRLGQDPQRWQRFNVSGPRRWFFKSVSAAAAAT